MDSLPQLDNLDLIKRIDSANIFSYLHRFDRQVAQALTLSEQLDPAKWMGHAVGQPELFLTVRGLQNPGCALQLFG